MKMKCSVMKSCLLADLAYFINMMKLETKFTLYN